MRAAEQQRIDVGGLDRCQQPLGEDRDLVARRLAALDELDEARARGCGQIDIRTGRRNRSLVGTGADRTDRADHSDTSRRARFHQRPRARLDDVDDQDGQFLLQHVERRGRRRVACDDDGLHIVLLHEAPRQLPGEFANLGLRSRSVRIPAGVADVHEMFGRQQVDDGTGNGESTEPTVEHPDRSGHLGTHIDGPGYGGADVLRSTHTC